jgi:hypothetical protein
MLRQTGPALWLAAAHPPASPAASIVANAAQKHMRHNPALMWVPVQHLLLLLLLLLLHL